MLILGIETSCDETALALIEADSTGKTTSVALLGDELFSQIHIHKEYGGVYPMMAKREHAKNLIPLLTNLLKKTGYLEANKRIRTDSEEIEAIGKILFRETELKPQFIEFIERYGKPPIDAIAVTYGPGLEPALWVGLNFAFALQKVWKVPVIPVNHMEGHIVSTLLPKDLGIKKQTLLPIDFPLLALLISGGHTELVLAKNWFQYEIVGQTRDDAVGEAYDKVARILGLPYPGGPEIARLAERFRERGLESPYKLPRPMIATKNLDFSFSGLKTAVLYTVKKIPELTEDIKQAIAGEFENAVVDVLVAKTKAAIEQYHPETIVVGGGVIANKRIRESLFELCREYPDKKLYTPHVALSTDNAIMIALAGFFRHMQKTPDAKFEEVSARGNIRLQS